MSRLRELYDERDTIAAEIQRLRDVESEAGGNIDAEHERQWQECNGDYNRLSRSIEMEKRAEEVARETNREADAIIEHLNGSGGLARREQEEEREIQQSNREIRKYGSRRTTAETRARSLQGWMMHQCGLDVDEEHRDAMRQTGALNSRDYVFDLRSDRSYDQLRREYRASTAATEGGETIAEDFSNSFEIALLQFGAMRNVAEIMRTETGAAMPWPTIDDSSNVAQIEGEGDAVATTDIVTSSVTFNAYKYSSDAVLVSHELLQDSAFNLSQIIGRLLGERIGRKTNADFTTADGSSKPNGIVGAATAYQLATGSTTTFDGDDIIDLVHQVDPAYRNSATFMLHDTLVGTVRKLKNGSGDYIWQPGLTLGDPDRILGYPIQINQDMDAAPAANDKVVVFGDLSKYKIREVGQIRFRRLVERYADTDQEAFIAFWRGDGDLVDAGTNPVKVMQMSAT